MGKFSRVLRAAMRLTLTVLGASPMGSAPAEDPTARPRGPRPDSSEREPQRAPAGSYSLVQSVFNWGAAYHKILLPSGDGDGARAEVGDYDVSVWRYGAGGELLDHGTRRVARVYPSDARGSAAAAGHTALELEIVPADGLSAPFYTDPASPMGQHKAWARCSYTITRASTGEVWNRLSAVYRPDEEAFETGLFTGGERPLSYAWYAPPEDGKRHPLIVWLHGAGSGGTDVGFVTGGMLVTNLIARETQRVFGGAHVLLPQCDTFWMSNGADEPLDAGPENVYRPSLMALIESYAAGHADVDPERLFLIGCSNGGYMTMDLLISYPDTFAAAVPICEAYMDRWITRDRLARLAATPVWFVHGANDPIVDAQATCVPTHRRLLAAGARDAHLSLYDSIVDPDYGNVYGGHFAWVYALKGMCDADFDGSPVLLNGKKVNLFEWMAAHTRPRR